MKKNYSTNRFINRCISFLKIERLQDEIKLQKLKFYSALTSLFTLLLCASGTTVLAQSALSFGSSNTTTYVTFGNKPALGLSQFTLECWFKRTGTGVTTSTGTGGVTSAIPLVTKGTSEGDGSNIDCNYFMGINTSGNTLCADFEEGAGGTSPGLNHPISGTTAIVNNVWYHAAATYDGATWKLYLNGTLEGTLAVNQPCQNLSIQHSAIGASIRSNGTTIQGFFAGVMDEVRIWNSAKTIAAIQSAINSQISSPQSGMVARWGLNEGTGTSILDNSGNVLTGTLTGTNYTWISSVAPFNLTFNTNVAPTIAVNAPSSNAQCIGSGPVNLSVSVADANTSNQLTVKFYGRKKGKVPADFTLIGLPDTQFYTEHTNGGNNSTFKAQTNWIVANKDVLNIKHVSQLGDCVQNGDNGGNDIEWKRADTSMKIIENPIATNLTDGIPYSMSVGNHDQSPGGDAAGTTTFFNQYFGTSRFSSRAYWGGNFGSNADNSYQLFSANGIDFIVVSLEYDVNANASVISWANTLLQTYSTRKAIIVSHWIINADGTFGAQGQAVYNGLKANPNLMLMLCGHINPNGEARRSDLFAGKTVHTLLSDYQDINGGNGWLRIMTFSPSTNTGSVKTYSPTLNQFQTDANSQFTISDLNLFDNPLPYQLLSTQTTIGSGTLNYNWTIEADSSYEWYATVMDSALITTSSTNQFTASSKPVVNLGNDTTLACGQQVTLDAGNPGLTYLWSTGAITQTMTPNLEGSYSVKVTNTSGCFQSDTIAILYPGKTSVTISKNITNNCSGGSAILTATTGMTSYVWSTGETTNPITVTTATTYSVLVTDNSGCQNTASTTVAFAAGFSATASVTNVSCNGGSNGAINVTPIGGISPYTYLWNTGATTQSLSALSPNTYTVTITDQNGCTFTLTPTVTQPTALTLTAPTITPTNGGYNGTIKVNPTGGTTPYTYFWKYNNAGANITTQTLSTTHVGGTYVVTVTDAKACTAVDTYSHAIPVVSGSTVLLPWSSTWKYKDDGSNQGTAWRATTFDDSSWPSAQAEFGYSDGDEKTLINACGTVVQTPTCTNKYFTTYLRKTITVASLSGFQNIKFNAFRDDGIIVYVNNTEVYRSGVQTGTIAYNTALSAAAADDGETVQTQTVAIASSFFVVGNNTIAIELHQQNGSSSDVTFNMEILGVPPVPEVLTRGPYLLKATQTSMEVKWLTDQAATSKVRYGTTTGVYTDSVVNLTASTSHVINLINLLPNTKYYYTIGSSTRQLQGDAGNNFVTPPVPGSEGKYNFWLVGDCGNNSTNQKNVRDAYINYMGSNTTNGWLLLGDNAYSSGTESEFQAEFFDVYQGTVSKSMPLYPSPGNHDYNNGSQFDHNVPYYSIFDMPANGEAGGVASNTEAYYSYDYGNIHFLSLDSYGKEDGVNRLYDTLGPQVLWIKQDLAANTKKWVVAYWHHPPYTMGSHNSDTESELTKMHTNFIRILERYKVDLVVCGHSHEYERSKLIQGSYGNEASFNPAINNVSQSNGRYDGTTNSCTYMKDSTHTYKGTVYVVAGSAGQLDGNVQAAWPHNAMSGYNNSTNGGSMLLTVEGNRLDSKWVCADGIVRDQFTMIKDANKIRNYTVNTGQSLTLTASWKGQYSWNHNGATTASVTVNPTTNFKYVVSDQFQCVADTFNVTVVGVKGPSCSQSPYLLPTIPAGQFTSILTATDTVAGYKMCGTPDGLGAFDNGNGTFTILMNHEFGNTAGVARAHGSKGAFVSKWIVNKSNLSVLSGSDLIQTVKLWNGSGYTSYNSSTPSPLTAFNRFCSADLPPLSAFYNSATGLGTQERIFMNGEEAGNEGRALAHIVTGTEAGTSYELPYLGKLSWENSVACPFTGDKTVVAGLDDSTPGQVYFYIGTKTNTGTNIDKAGLTNGKLFGIAVTGLSTETSATVPAPNSPFTLADLGQVQNLTGAVINTNSNNIGITTFLRPEDGAWDPTHPGDFYFNTTNAFNSPSRLWKVHFTNINNPELGGTITAVLDGTEGQQMLDNLTIDNSGHILLVEDVGGNAHLGKTWQYTIATDELKQIGTHDPTRFLNGSPNFLTQDEEASGIVDVQSILGPGMFLTVDQAHYGIAGEVVEGGQLLAYYNPDSYNASPLAYIVNGGGSYCQGDTVGLPVGLSNSQTTINYQLIKNDTVLVGAPLAGTGSPLSFGNQTATGTYTIIGTSAINNSTTTMTGSATLNVNPPPIASVTVDGSTNFCAADSVLLTATGGGLGAAYLWSTGETIQTIVADTTGNYSVVITDANGCSSASSTPVTITTYTLTADFNSDGKVTNTDLNLLLLKFGTTCNCLMDLNHDGQVTTVDLSVLLVQFGQTCSGQP
jgi:hypothetical protein